MGDQANIQDGSCQGGTLLASLPPDTTQYTVANLSPGTTYVFHVQATDATGNQGCLPASSLTTPPLWLQYLHDYWYAIPLGLFGVLGLLVLDEQIHEKHRKPGQSLLPGLL